MSLGRLQGYPSSSSSSSLLAPRDDIEVVPLSPGRRPSHGIHRRQTSSSSSLGGLHTQHHEHIYFDDAKVPIPPHLHVSAASGNTNQRAMPFASSNATGRYSTTSEDGGGNQPKEEADAAAGIQSPNVLQRVSSFNLLSRVTSNPRLFNLTTPTDEPSENGGSQPTRNDDQNDSDGVSSSFKPNWRLRDSLKTTGVGLIMTLNIGTDPPDVIKPHPCAKLQCWMDPYSVSRAKARERIGERLEAQYAVWQQRSTRQLFVKYRRALDPTVEDVRAMCLWLRRQAKTERVLLHYNGHGVPWPTPDGEIWVFDRNYTEYIPLSISDLRHWAGSPTICILDCSSAGVLIPFLTAPPGDTAPSTPASGSPSQGSSGGYPSSQQQHQARQSQTLMDMDTAANVWVKDVMVLCPTSEGEALPMDPAYPADIFTSCLTTPIQIALRWFVRNNRASMGDIDPEVVDSIPGKANDRKTPLGELNWIFTSITDSIAWNVFPKPLFQRLFRQDLLVACMFRNFLLADRILRRMNCTPQSYPPLPLGVADHPLWYAWDLACETFLLGLLKDGRLSPRMGSKGYSKEGSDENHRDRHFPVNDNALPKKINTKAESPNPASSQSLSSPFFTEQLTAFEVWLEYASMYKGNPNFLDSPEQLPVVLQVLLSQIHRVRALDLLRRFLELGPWAVNLSLSLGIFPYIGKLLQSPEYKTVLVNIWASILKFDPSCQVDLVKGKALGHFIQPLASWASPSTQIPPVPLLEAAKQRTLVAFALAVTCYKYPQAQIECLRQNLHGACTNLLSAQVKLQQRQKEQAQLDAQDRRASSDASLFEILSPLAREWLCLCMGNLVQAYPPAQVESYNTGVHVSLMSLQQDDDDPNVRAAATFALGCLVEHRPPSFSNSTASASLSGDGTPPVRAGSSNLYSRMIGSPSPISLGPQAFANAPLSGGNQIAIETSARPQQPQIFLSQQPTVSSAVNAGSMTVVIPANDGVGGLSQPMWRGNRVPPPQGALGSAMLPSNVHPNGIQTQQPGMQLMTHQLSHATDAHTHASHQGAHTRALDNQSRVDQRKTQTTLPESQIQPDPIFLAQQGGAGLPQANMSGQGSTSGPVRMISQPSYTSNPIGMPLIGSPIQGPSLVSVQPIIAPGLSDPQPAHTQSQQHRRATVFEDRRRLEFDMKVMESMVKAVADGSPMVRYELVMSLSSFVEKYLQAFLVVAEDGSRTKDTGDESNDDVLRVRDDKERVVPLPRGVNQLIMERFGKIWKVLRQVQHHDPHSRVLEASSTIVRVVHETLMDMRVERDGVASNKKSPGLSEIQEEGEDGIERATSDIHLSILAPSDAGAESTPNPQPNGPSWRLPSVKLYPLRRAASETTGGNFPIPDVVNSSVPPIPLQNPIARVRAEKLLPKSRYYLWKHSMFRPDYDHDEDLAAEQSDPLNPFGSARSYQRKRNAQATENGHRLAKLYVDLMPRARPAKKSLDMLLEENDEDDEDDKIESLKNDLRVKEACLLKSDSDAKMTSMLKFHSFEDALISCDNVATVTVWDYEKGDRKSVFSNGNRDGSRMTSAFWLNETSSSLFFVGCDDGSARVWKGILEYDGRISSFPPSLSTAFFGVPEMEPGIRGNSGLICEWQQKSGTLIAGGSSRHLHCWDLESEKCSIVIETETHACITSLATAWDEEKSMSTTSSRGVAGPDVVVAGHSDGSLRIFDIRMPKIVASIDGRSRNRRKPLNSTLTEHGSWVVDTCFTSYGGKSEIISGSVAGDIRAWDLRMSTSSRTFWAQRSPMTALAVHKRIPMIATGSHAQFIKVLTMDGEALQVVRFHDAMPGHRIGPVSCLEFHKEKLVLAAGSTNSLVNIYKPRIAHTR